MKEKWYLATGRESEDVMGRVTHVIFSDGGVFCGSSWAWHDVSIRTKQRLFKTSTLPHSLVVYTLGETVEGGK